jgi:3-phosphoshikimate 1-carboxyvinyltransferase
LKDISVPTKNILKGFEAKVPGSKSLTNRALIAAFLCDKPVLLKGCLESEDTILAKKVAEELGVEIKCDKDHWLIDGSNLNRSSKSLDLFMGNSGTTLRFMSSVLCAKGIACVIKGTDRMHQRPVELLINALNKLGGDIKSIEGTGCPPLEIKSKVMQGGEVSLSGQVSSQYFSGLMLAAPLLETKSIIKVSDAWLSLPYIQMTHRMLESFSIKMDLNDDHILIPGNQIFKSPGEYSIEPDASAATYPLALGVLHNVSVNIPQLGRNSLQGDTRFVDRLKKMGCEVEVKDNEIKMKGCESIVALNDDLNDIPDAAMTLVVLCSIAKGHSKLTGLKNLAFKECDRLTALETELNKMGAKVVANEDGFEIEGVSLDSLKPAEIETYKDHRIAMCLSLLGTLVPGVTILDPMCVEKTYPQFWKDLDLWMGVGE